MSGNNIVADTSFLINFFNGSVLASNLLANRTIWISGITEIELLAFPKLSSKDKKVIQSFINECFVINLETDIKTIAIDLRTNYKVRLPDAIIAATSIWLDFPLFTMDRGFKRIAELNTLIL